MASFKHGTTEHGNGGYGPQRHKYVHILVAEGMIGRELLPNETVHHKDGNERNPRWNNLVVIDVKIHNAISRKQYWYLKQKFSKEEAAWKAYFDITGDVLASAHDA